MNHQRHTADTITDDALDALYENASRGWRRGDDWKQKATEARTALAAVLGIVSAWCVESNDVGGIDAGDLAWRLEQAGHPLPDEDSADAAPAQRSDR